MNKNSIIAQDDFQNQSEKIGCTHFYFGEYGLLQPKYRCLTCLNDSICLKCIKKCHINCDTDYPEKSSVNNTNFVCRCATKQSHKVTQFKQSQAVRSSKCNLSEVDFKLRMKFSFRCSNHKVKLCSFCFLNCHSECEIYKETETENEENLNMSSVFGCGCKYEDNHLYYNHFIFETDFRKYKEITETLFDCKLQMINYLFESGVFNEMKIWLNTFLDDSVISQPFRQVVRTLSECLKKKILHPGYIVDEISSSFSAQKLIRFLNNYKPENEEDLYLCFDLMTILYNVHLKPDFNHVKYLSVSDYANSAILERLSLRRVVENFGSFNTKFIDKYGKNFSALKVFIFNFDPKHEVKEDNISRNYPFLKIVKFCLKRCLFNSNDLSNLVSTFQSYYMRMVFTENEKLEEESEKKEKIALVNQKK